MTTAIKVSLITVCYNAESLIENTLQSAANQTFKNLFQKEIRVFMMP